ncbi:MAG TPA: PAS domain S-box protein [Allosphingosinicella sp.]|nr:PAS domain S-box protein [Allosphingosinicella sp.]
MADHGRFDSHFGEQRFQLLVNAITDYAVYMLDREGYVATWNPGARRFKGYEPAEIVGQHFSRFFTDEDRATGLPQRALHTAATEGKFETEGWRVRKDGTRMWAHVVIDPILDDTGTLVGFAKITRDITDRKSAEQALFESEQRFRMLVQGVHDYAIYMLDPTGVVSNWNTGAERIKGYKAGEIVGEHFSRFYTPEDRANGEPERALATALAEGKYEKEAWRLRSDGTRFWAHVVIDPIRDERGALIGFAKITRDATERRNAQIELEEARAALFQAQKLQALGELTGGIAHDFNNLMTVIRGSADLLRRSDLAEEKKGRYLDAIVETADRAATLTGQLLAFSRRQRLKPEVIDLNLRLDAFGEMLERTLGGQVDVTLDLAPGLWRTEADPTQLETALLNAAINARDAMPDGGTLAIRTCNAHEKEGDFVVVELSDTGTGMPEEVLNRAYEPFFTTKPVGKGTGLGLSQVHGFAAQSGGRTELSSKAGEGTILRLYLPRADREAAPPASAPPAARRGDGRTVLLVEDNDHVRAFAEHLLADLGYEVLCAASAEQALEMLKGREVDIVFSDIVMPEMSGLDLARLLAERRPDLPIVLATGYSEETVSGDAAAFEVLSKPYGADTLGGALARALAAEPGKADSGA